MNVALLAVILAVAGGAGSVCRVLVDALARERWSGSFPGGIVLVNVSGSFALGVAHGLWALTAPDLLLVVGTGFLGAYTTFSTAMVDAASLLRDGRAGAAAMAVLGGAVASVAAAALGVVTGAAV